VISVVINRPSSTGRDKYGDPVSASTTTTTVIAEAIAPSSTVEPTGRDRQGIVIGYTLYLPYGTDILSTDTVTIAAAPFAGSYDIEGEPAQWVDPFTGVGRGIVAELRRTEG
jgi:hypothetical protein